MSIIRHSNIYIHLLVVTLSCPVIVNLPKMAHMPSRTVAELHKFLSTYCYAEKIPITNKIFKNFTMLYVM